MNRTLRTILLRLSPNQGERNEASRVQDPVQSKGRWKNEPRSCNNAFTYLCVYLFTWHIREPSSIVLPLNHPIGERACGASFIAAGSLRLAMPGVLRPAAGQGATLAYRPFAHPEPGRFVAVVAPTEGNLAEWGER